MAQSTDYLLARKLQSEFDKEFEEKHTHPKKPAKHKLPTILIEDNSGSEAKLPKQGTLVDPEWEVIDPTPDIFTLFINFNKRFFWNALESVEVRWSPRMYSCAGVCSYEGRSGLCSIRISEPLLKLRPRSDLVETLLHEMIHAYLFVTKNDRDRDGHGPEFRKHMSRINQTAGTNITIYHSFHDEVRLYQKHWWRCDGPCNRKPPFFGMVKRSMNRAPGPNDFWWTTHQATCGGTFIKVRDPKSDATKAKKGESKTGQKEATMKNKSLPKLNVNNDGKSKSRSGGVGSLNTLNNYGVKVLNKGTLVSTITSPSIALDESVAQPKGESFLPFSGKGYTLGVGSSCSHSKPVSSLAERFTSGSCRMPSQETNNNVNVSNGCSPEKYKADFFHVTLSDDELADVEICEGVDDDHVCCPVCNMTTHRDDMPIHLQSCDILNVTLESMNDSSTLEIDEDGDETKESGEANIPLATLPCPCCSKCVLESDINKHLDECLSMLAIKEFEKDWDLSEARSKT